MTPAIAHLIGSKCPECGTYVFPPRENNCPNPACASDALEPVALSTPRNAVELHRKPLPPPAALSRAGSRSSRSRSPRSQLADEGLIVLGKVVEGTLAADLKVGMEMELTTMPLFTDDDGVERIVYAWRIGDRS